MPLRIGTRGSALARWQSDWVAAELRRRGHDVELVYIVTAGDQQQQAPIGAMGSLGLFTKEIQRALLEGRIDLTVHSLKDLPTEEVPGLVLTAVPPRAPVADAWLSRDGTAWADVPPGARVGTGSLRRRAQLLHVRPDLKMLDIRGNVDTRLRKLREGQFDAIVLAEAGLRRLGLDDQITGLLPGDMMLPAIGQGALGLETRADDETSRAALAALNDPATHAAVAAERALLARLRGGCLAPIAAWGRCVAGQLLLHGRVLSADGRVKLEASAAVAATAALSPAEGAALGQGVADDLLRQGAAGVIQSARQTG